MIDDFKPAKRRTKSLPVSKGKPLGAMLEQRKAAKDQNEPDENPSTAEEFLTPEQVAAADTTAPETVAEEAAPLEQPDQPKQAWYKKLWPPTKKWSLILGAILILLVGGLTGFLLTRHQKPVITTRITISKKPIAAIPKSLTVPSTLSGLQVPPIDNTKPVTAVMIENSLDARPQSGLSSAGVVFEAVAEGGVTRFMALYQDTAPANVGPIRSARPYYIQWSLGFDAGYAHVGGSADGLADIKAWDVRDLDEFYNGDYYHRITTREAPHNVYTAIATLNQLETVKGYTSSDYSGFPRKIASPVATPTAATINLTLSGYDYDPSYSYAASTNSYNRSEAGAPQTDANTNTQLSPNVVIAIVVPETQGALDASGAYYSNYNVIGSGTAYVFQDGTVTTGTWSKSSNTAQITFAGASGQAIKLNPGQTWITAVTSPSDVSYTP